MTTSRGGITGHSTGCARVSSRVANPLQRLRGHVPTGTVVTAVDNLPPPVQIRELRRCGFVPSVGYSPFGACCVPTAMRHNTSPGPIARTHLPVAARRPLAGPHNTGHTDLLPFPPYVFADAEHDGDVDQTTSGPSRSATTGWMAGCRAVVPVSIRDEDTDVDADDFTAFSKCWTRPEPAVEPAITPVCVP